MKKLILSLHVAVAMGLSGCGDDQSLQEIEQTIEQDNSTVTPVSRVVFDPTGGRLSVPNDLLFTGTTDGTLEMPDEVAARAANGAADYSDPGQALGVLDGWSTQNPWVMSIDFPTGYSLHAPSAQTPGSVRIFEVRMGQEPGCEEVPRGAACAPVNELTFGADFVTSASGNSVAVAPLRPLKPKTTYIVALTTGLQDVDGSGNTRPISPSTTYELVRQDINTAPLGTPSQLALQGAVNSYEGVLAAGFGVDTETLIFTSAMTTQSVGDVVGTVKTMMAATLATNPQAVPAVAVQPTGLTVANALVAAGAIDAGSTEEQLFSSALLYAGNVTLPYYSGLPSAENPMAPVNSSWKAACDSGVMVQGFAAQVGDAYPYNPETTAPISANDAACIALSGGALRDFTNPETGFVLDKERHLTKFNTIPMMRGMQTHEVQMTVPEINTVNFIRTNFMGLDPIAEPEAGWPVVILVHGITSRKEDMLPVTANLALGGFASIAIDQPLHGSRGFNLDGVPGDEINASTVSATHFMNLANLPATRDNLRQATVDLLGLRFAMNFAQGVDLDMSRVYNLGLSLGGIISTNFLAMTNLKNLDANLGAPGLDALFNVNAGALASAGGGLANLLIESGSFGPLVQGSILSGAGTALSNEFNAFLAAPAADCAHLLPNQEAYLVCGTQVFLFGLSQAGEDAKLAEVRSLISSFVFAAQSVTDAGDPNNYGVVLGVNGTPVLMNLLVGDGMENLPDQVVPNQTLNTPIGGTEPLVRAIGLANKPITATTQGAPDDNGIPAKISGVVRFTKGHHVSLVFPGVRPEATEPESNARVTQEMQSQIVSYFSADGRAIAVIDDEFIVGAN